MGESINISPFLGVSLTLLFIFSTLYTCIYSYNVGVQKENTANGLEDIDNDGSFGFDSIIGAISWISPFGFVKLILRDVIMIDVPDFYFYFDMLLLRPIGWFVFLVQANYIISLLPTVGKGE